MAPSSPKSFTVKTEDGVTRRMTQLEVSQYVRTSMQRAKLQVSASDSSPVSHFGSSQPRSPAGSAKSFQQNGPPAPEARQPDERVKLKISTEHNKSSPMSPRDLPPISPRDLPPISPRDPPSTSARDLPLISPRALESIDVFQDKSISRLSDATNDHAHDLMSTASMMSTQSFTVATEAEGTKLLSQEEVSQLVRSSMQRARQRKANKAATPQATPRTPNSTTPRTIPRIPNPVLMSPKYTRLASSLQDDAPWAPSPSRKETPEIIVIEEEDDEGEPSPTNMSARDEMPEVIFVEEEDEEDESSPINILSREETPEVTIMGEEDETPPTVMPLESISRKFTWSLEEEQSEEDVDSYESIDPAERASSSENITPITSGRSASEDEDTVNCYSKDLKHFPDEKEGPAENKVPSIFGKDVVSVGQIMNKPAAAIEVEQSRSTDIDKVEASSVTEKKQSRPSTPPPNSDDEMNGEEPTSEASKEELLTPLEDSITEAQEHACEEIQGLLDASKTSTGDIQITTDSGEIRRMSEAEINNLFKVAMQKARESAQQEMRELVQTSMAAAREEMRDVVRDSISTATPKFEVVEVAKSSKDSSRSEIPRVVSRPVETSEPPRESLLKQVQTSMAATREENRDVVRDSISTATPKIEVVEVFKSSKDSSRSETPRVASRPLETSEPSRESLLKQEDTSSQRRRRQLSPRRLSSPRRQKQLNETMRHRSQQSLGKKDSPKAVSTTHNRASMLSSHKMIEQQDSISLPSDHQDQETAAGSKVAKDSSPSPWDVDPSTQFDNGWKQTKDSSRSPWHVDPSTQFFSTKGENGGVRDTIEFTVSNSKEVSRSNKHEAELKEEDCERPEAQGVMEKNESNKEKDSTEVLQEMEKMTLSEKREHIKLGIERKEKNKEKKHLTVETSLTESESEPVLLTEEGKKAILSKAVNHLKNLEKERTLFVPIEKTGKETSPSHPKAEEAESLAYRPPRNPTKRIVAIPFTPEQTDNPAPSSAFTDFLSSEDVPTKAFKSPPTEILSPELPTEIMSLQASNASPHELPEILSPNVRDAHHIPSQWTQNLLTTRDEDNVVEETPLAPLPDESGITSEDDDSRLEVMRRQRALLSPKGTKFMKSGEERKLALMRRKPSASPMPYELSEDDRGDDARSATRSAARSAARSVARSATRSQKGKAKRQSKQKPPAKTSTDRATSTETLKAPVKSTISEMVKAEEISRDDANTPRSPSSRDPNKWLAQSVSSVSLMLSQSYDSGDRDTVVTEELINRIAALKGSKVSQEELNKLLGSVTDKAQAITKSVVSQSSLSRWEKREKEKKESNLCMDIFDLWPVREEDDDDDETGYSLDSSWLEDVAIPADTYMQYNESLSTSQEKTELSFAPGEALSYSFSPGHRSSFTELESVGERNESVSGGESFSPGWWRK